MSYDTPSPETEQGIDDPREPGSPAPHEQPSQPIAPQETPGAPDAEPVAPNPSEPNPFID